LLTRQGKAAGVLVHPTVWNRVLQRLDDLEATVWTLEAELDIARGKSELIEVSEEDLQAWIQAADADAEAANIREKAVPGDVPGRR
jgi:hypothetical protein